MELQKDAEALFSKMTQVYGAEGLERVQGLLENVAANVTFNQPDPLYKALPPNLVFPGLPEPQPWWDNSVYPWIPRLENEKDRIVKEIRSRLKDPDVLELQEMYGMQHGTDDSGWRALNFQKYFQENKETKSLFPQLKSVLDDLPIGSDASVSILEPGGIIHPHTDNYNFTLTCHLALDIPENDVELTVGGQSRSWQEGKCWVMDHSYEHHGFNKSDHSRVVLVLNVWHFDLSEKEISCMKQFQPNLLEFWMKASEVNTPA